MKKMLVLLMFALSLPVLQAQVVQSKSFQVNFTGKEPGITEYDLNWGTADGNELCIHIYGNFPNTELPFVEDADESLTLLVPFHLDGQGNLHLIYEDWSLKAHALNKIKFFFTDSAPGATYYITVDEIGPSVQQVPKKGVK